MQKIEKNIKASEYYDESYFEWQKKIGKIGGWANSYKFKDCIKEENIVIDFGCGGGFLLKNLNCKKKIGIEPNKAAIKTISENGVEHFFTSLEVKEKYGSNFADIIISNHALEHTLNPLQEIKDLYPLLKENGIILFYVPCDSINYAYNPNDPNYHLFSWSPQNLGNLFFEAGYKIEYVHPHIHKWPPMYIHLSNLGWPLFNFLCKVYGRINRKWNQIVIKAQKI
jgi:SAM-dependent methyltransferase